MKLKHEELCLSAGKHSVGFASYSWIEQNIWILQQIFHKFYLSVLRAPHFTPQKLIKLEKVVCMVLNTLATKTTFTPMSKDIFPFATFVVEWFPPCEEIWRLISKARQMWPCPRYLWKQIMKVQPYFVQELFNIINITKSCQTCHKVDIMHLAIHQIVMTLLFVLVGLNNYFL